LAGISRFSKFIGGGEIKRCQGSGARDQGASLSSLAPGP